MREDVFFLIKHPKGFYGWLPRKKQGVGSHKGTWVVQPVEKADLLSVLDTPDTHSRRINCKLKSVNQPLHIPPTRKAVLIGSPGRGENRLQGVENDLENYYQFLLSPRGGVFYEHEIIVLADPTIDEVLNAIHSSYADYQFVYYSGHGNQDIYGNDFICLDGNDLQDNYLFNATGPRQFLLLDSCRKFYPTISGFPKEMERWKSAVGYSVVRAMFDRYILNSPPGKMKMYAASAGQVAMDNRDGHGGEFTLALLKGIYNISVSSGYHAIFPGAALEDAKRNLQAERLKQVPELVNVEGNLQVPLGIASPQIISKDLVEQRRQQVNIQQQFERSRQRRSNQTAAGLFIAGLIIWFFSK